MTLRRWLQVGFALMLPLMMIGAASQISSSRKAVINTREYRERQLIRCDTTGTLVGTSATNGEVCEAGDWSKPIDCRGKVRLKVEYHNYAGTSTAKIWDCVPSTGFAAVGSEAPATAPTSANPSPLCSDLTSGAGVVLNGSTITRFTLDGSALSFIVGEIDTCAGCDSTLVAVCSP